LAEKILARIKELDSDVVADVADSYYGIEIEELLGGVFELFDGTAITLGEVLVDQNELLRVVHAGDREIVMSSAFHSGEDPADDVDNPVAMAVGLVCSLGVTIEPIRGL
jgi:hypothetical protein